MFSWLAVVISLSPTKNPFFFLGVDPIIWEQAKVDNPDPDK